MPKKPRSRKGRAFSVWGPLPASCRVEGISSVRSIFLTLFGSWQQLVSFFLFCYHICDEIKPCVYVLYTGRDGDLFLRYFLHRGAVQSSRSRLRPAPRIVFAKHLEHNGLRRRRHRVRERYALLAPTDRATCCVSENLANRRNKLYNKSTTNRSNGVRELQLTDLQ